MQPQFLSRFDNAVILEDLTRRPCCASSRSRRGACSDLPALLPEVRRSSSRSPRKRSRKIAEEAAKSSRIGARALKSVYGKIIKPFEFDPFAREEVKAEGAGHRLVLDEEIVGTALKPPY